MDARDQADFAVDYVSLPARIREWITGAPRGMLGRLRRLLPHRAPHPLIVRTGGTDPASLTQEHDAVSAEPDDITAPDGLPPVPPRPAGGARRVRWPIALALVWAVLAATDLVFFHSGITSTRASAAKPAATRGVTAHRHAGASAPPHPAPTATHASARPTAPAQALVPVSASAVGPAGSGPGNNPQLAPRAIDASTATAWLTDWYRTARFGALQPGTGLLIDMGHRVRITSAQIILGSTRGADLRLLTGNTPAQAAMRHQASAKDAGGTLQLNLARPQRARYVLIWFTLLPPDSAGTFQASVYNVRLEGTP